MSNFFEGKTFIVTGASAGISRGLAAIILDGIEHRKRDVCPAGFK